MDKHITITDIGSGYVRLTPDNSYTLIKNNDTSRHFSDAEIPTEDIPLWSAIKM